MLLLAVTLTVIAYSAQAQSESGTITGSIELQQSVAKNSGAQFRSLPPVELPSTAADFRWQLGGVFSGGVGAAYSLSKAWQIGMGVGVRWIGNSFTAEEPTIFSIGGKATPGTILHQADIGLLGLDLSPSVAYYVSTRFSLQGGLIFSFPLSSSVRQTESIISPEEVTYLDGTNTRVNAEGSVATTTLVPSLFIAPRYSFPFGSTFVLSFGARAEYTLSSFTPAFSWKETTFSLGTELRFNIYRSTVGQMLYDTLIRRDTVARALRGDSLVRVVLLNRSQNTLQTQSNGVQRRTLVIEEHYEKLFPAAAPMLIATLTAGFVNADGSVAQTASVSVRKSIRRSYIPLLPKVFFDAGSSALPQRYKQGMPDLYTQGGDSITKVYYHLLAIIATRLQQHPGAKLTMNGYALDDEPVALAAARTRTIADYLYASGISRQRFVIKTLSLPRIKLKRSAAYESEERRCVEFTSDTPEILAPYEISDTIVVADPPIVHFTPTVLNEAEISTWKLSVHSGGKKLVEFSGSGMPTPIDWNLNGNEHSALLYGASDARYILEVQDREGNSARSAEGKVSFSTVRASTNVLAVSEEVHSLMFFDYDDVVLLPENERSVQKLRERMKGDSIISITGTADESGDAAYNMKLSRLRAEAVANALGVPVPTIRGAGSSRGSLPQGLPEGRLYRRRVDILLRKK